MYVDQIVPAIEGKGHGGKRENKSNDHHEERQTKKGRSDWL